MLAFLLHPVTLLSYLLVITKEVCVQSTVNGLVYNIEQSGEGQQQALFIHYFGGSGASWAGVIQLVPGIRCVAPDLAGFGTSQAPEPAYTVDQHAADLHALVEQLGFADWALVGHSMGGKIALALAALQPTGLRELILVAPSPPTPEPMTDKDRKHMLSIQGDRAALEQQIQSITAHALPANLLAQATDENTRTSASAWRAWLEDGSNENIADRLSQITVPVTIISGEQDSNIAPALITSEVTPYLTSTSARVSVLPDVGHLVPYERPQAIADALTDERR